jgi:chorismate synthase
MAIRFLTAGESHGKGLLGIIEGLPAGLSLSAQDINPDLKRRQGGYGRGGRMKIESDTVEIISGVRWGKTLGSPLAMMVHNLDYKNWAEGMSAEASDSDSIDPVTRPRPGHADLPGALKYAHTDVRNVLERSSARETAMRVAVGAVMKRYLAEFGILIGSYVTSVGGVEAELPEDKNHEMLAREAEGTELRTPDKAATEKMIAAIDTATKEGYSLGGIFQVFALGVPVGLGSHVHWDRRLDGKLAQALMSIQAIKGVECGLGFEAARRPGNEVMDEIGAVYPPLRASNNAGGIEGGISNGMPILFRVAMKPIPTLRRALKSVDIETGKQVEAAYERSDVCAVPAASVIAEAVMACTLAEALNEKFGGDSIGEATSNLEAYIASLEKRRGTS